MYNQLRWKEINVKARMKRKACKDSFTVINQSTEVQTGVDLLIIIILKSKIYFFAWQEVSYINMYLIYAHFYNVTSRQEFRNSPI